MNPADLTQLRTDLIQALNKVDDLLGYERTIPPKAKRRRVRRGLVAKFDDLKQLRSSLIQAINKVDDLLGYERTIPPKAERNWGRKRRGLDT